MSFINTLSIVIGPVLAIYVATRYRDKLNSRDATILYISFFISILTVVPSLVIKHTASELGFSERSMHSLFGKIGYATFAGFIDELNKYIVIIAYAYRRKEFDEPLAGILVCVMIALGFTTADNVWHVISNDLYSDTWRMLLALPVALGCAVVLGFYAGMSKYGLDSDDLSSFSYRIRGLASATFFHAFYNFFLFMEEYSSLTILIGIGIVLLLMQVALNLFRAQRLHSRLVYSRRKRS